MRDCRHYPLYWLFCRVKYKAKNLFDDFRIHRCQSRISNSKFIIRFPQQTNWSDELRKLWRAMSVWCTYLTSKRLECINTVYKKQSNCTLGHGAMCYGRIYVLISLVKLETRLNLTLSLVCNDILPDPRSNTTRGDVQSTRFHDIAVRNTSNSFILIFLWTHTARWPSWSRVVPES